MSIRTKFANWIMKDWQIGGRLIDTYGGTTSGVNVSEDSAMRLAAVNACVRVLSEDVASLPEHVYRRLDGGGKERARNHPLYPLLHDAPNPEMTAFTFKQTLMVNLLLTGNAYAFVEYDKAGHVMALWVLPSDMVEPFRSPDTGELRYHVQGWRDVSAFEMLHIPGLSYDGLKGLSPIAYARESIGLSKAAEEFGGRFFSNGSHLGGVIELDTTLEDAAFERLRAGFASMYKGLRNSHGVPILEGGAKFKPLGINQKDAQFLDTRKFQRSEIAAIFRVPPHMIGDLERATFSNIEHQSIEYLQRSLVPWLVRIEQEQCRKLLSPSERDLYVIEHDTANFLRGDTLSRMQAYSSAITAGIMTANECRQRENLNPMDGGDELLRPMNMTSAADPTRDMAQDAGKRSFFLGTELRSTPTDKIAENFGISKFSSKKLKQAFSTWLREQADAVLTIIRGKQERTASQDVDGNTKKVMQVINAYYADLRKKGCPQEMKDTIAKVCAEAKKRVESQLGIKTIQENGIDSDWMRGFIERYNETMSERLLDANENEIKRLLYKMDTSMVEKILDEWQNKRAESMAANEIAMLVNELTLAANTKCGINSIWLTRNCCAICSRMEGRIIRNLKPPLHTGCKCTVEAKRNIRFERISPSGKTFGIDKSGKYATIRNEDIIQDLSGYVSGTFKRWVGRETVIEQAEDIRDCERLVEFFGGEAKNWQKVKRTAEILEDGTYEGEEINVSIHWYRNSAAGNVDYKIKMGD